MNLKSHQKWWALGGTVLILVLCVLLGISCFVRYLRDESDLAEVDARARRLGIPQLAASQELSSSQSRRSLAAAADEVKRLKDFELCEGGNILQMAAFASSRSSYQKNLTSLSHVVDAWDAHRVAQCESDIDALGADPINTSSWIDRRSIIDFLALRLFTAQRQQVSVCELRLTRYLLTLDPAYSTDIAWLGLPFLTCRIDEIDSRRGEISGILGRLADGLPDRMRCYLSKYYEYLMTAARQRDVPMIAVLGEYPGWEDSSVPVASWEIRRWRADVLQHWIDAYTTLDCTASSAASTRVVQVVQPSRFAMGRGASDLSKYQRFSERVCLNLLMVQAIKAHIDGQPLPHDPFASAKQPIRSRVMGEQTLYYSVGRDGIDYGGQQGNLTVMRVWTPPISQPSTP